MLTNLFESRNKTFLNLVKLGDYIGRSLRENVELFSVDNDTVVYLTESGNMVKGNFDKSALKLTNIKVEDASIFEDKSVFSKLVDKKVNNFLADILENDLLKVEESFGSILNIWETRLHFDRVQKRLSEKAEKFNESLKIVTTPEFERLKEIKKDLIKFLKESNNFINIPEIRNTIKLSSVISKSFNTPRITLNNLSESKKFEIPKTINHTLYEHLCKQELITKEFLEAKNNLDHIWITNDKIQKLPAYIYESNDNIMGLVAEIITDVPYFSIATKKQLTSLVEGNLDLLTDRNVVSAKDIKDFVSKIYEFKKPVKNYLLNVLNEKYGINVQSLTDEPTFNSLAKTQIVIFEALAKLSPKNSVMKKVLYEFSELLKTKNGVETIDVADFLNEVFDGAKYTNILNETQLMNYLNFDKVADDLGKIGAVLKMIQAGMGGALGGGAGGAMGNMPGASPAPAAGMQKPEGPMGMAQEPVEGEGEYETDGGEMAGMGEAPDDAEMESENNPMPSMDSEDAAAQVGEEEAMEDQEGMPPEGMEGEEGDVEFVEKDELIDNLKNLEMLIADLKMDMGMGEEGGMEGEEGMGMEGEEMPEEGEEGELSAEEISPEEAEGMDLESDGEGEGEESESEESDDSEEEEPVEKKSKKSKPNFKK